MEVEGELGTIKGEEVVHPQNNQVQAKALIEDKKERQLP